MTCLVVLSLICLLSWMRMCESRRGGLQIPTHGNLNDTSLKLITKIEQYEELSTPIRRRNLVIFHVHQVDAYHTGLDVPTNNVKLFVSALMTHLDGSPQEAFYLFNVVGGRDNPLREYLPRRHPNVGIIDWLHANDETDLNMRTVKLLGIKLVNSFGAIFFTSSDVRGPLIHRKNGQWIQEYRKLLDSNNVGMVGPTINCENGAHVSTYMYAWRPKLFNLLWENEDTQEQQLGNSDFVRSSGYNISSVLYDRKYRTPYFNGRCVLGAGSKMMPTGNPVTWCHILPRDVIFMYWGGEAVRALGYICAHTQAVMRDALATLAEALPKLDLIVPETLAAGRLYEMYKQYSEEMHYDRIRPRAVVGLNTTLITTPNGKETGPPPTAKEVCFAVRTAFMHDSSQEVQSQNMFEDVDIDGFILSLLRQTNPAWVGYFFVTDTNPFEERLQEILNKYQDPRLVYVDIPPPYKVPFTKEDAGYTATDYVVSLLLKRRACHWVSATNADNIYGSHVVDRVINALPEPISKKVSDMLLNPIDSRNFMWADYFERRELTRGLGVEQTWTDYCTGLEASLLFNSYTYTVQPSPLLSKVDLASVFFNREKYAASGIRFGNFTDTKKYNCHGCQDGYLTEYLATRLRWSYTRLSIDGLKSIIFHGPSPTLCIATGNVWFDYPAVNKVGCISQQTVRMLSYHNPKYYDWIHLNFKSNKVCLRLSRTGFFSEVGQ